MAGRKTAIFAHYSFPTFRDDLRLLAQCVALPLHEMAQRHLRLGETDEAWYILGGIVNRASTRRYVH